MTLLEWTQLVGSLGEIVGAIAVVVTLAYLATQVQQARRQMELAGKQHRADAAREVLSAIVSSPELVRTTTAVGGFNAADFGLGSPEDRLRFAMWSHMWMRTEEMNFQVPEARETVVQLLKWWMSNPWGREFWNANRAIYEAEFADLADSLLQEVVAAEAIPTEMLARR